MRTTTARRSLSALVGQHCRVVVDNDWAGDPDGLVALAHHLLSPANLVVGVSSSFLEPKLLHGALIEGGTAAAGERLARELVEEFFPEYAQMPIVTGAESGFVPTGAGGVASGGSAASRLVIDAARTEHELPLYVVCGGPLTNIAQALADAPDILGRFELIWIGGSSSAETYEYNRDTDRAAAQFVLGHQGLVVHQVPVTVYRQCAYSIAELEVDLPATGELGGWLYDRFTSPPDWVRLGGVWPLGDSPPVLITALTTESSEVRTSTTDAGVTVHEYLRVDFRLLTGDLLARLRLHEGRRTTTAH